MIKFIENSFIRVRERQKVYAERLVSGAIQNMEEYKLNLGKYRGMIEAEEIIKKLYKEMTEGHIENEGKNDVERES